MDFEDTSIPPKPLVWHCLPSLWFNWGIYLAHYYGLANHPTQARFFTTGILGQLALLLELDLYPA